MANLEHLEILNQGVVVWNKWRSDNPTVIPDLRGINLSETILMGINLSKAILSGSNLKMVRLMSSDLRNAYLDDCVFIGTGFAGANLSGATLWRSCFRGADLGNAILFEAYLGETTFSGSNLVGTNFFNAIFGFTTLADVYLDYALGLEAVNHIAPSSVGFDTVFKSSGKIPDSFLRGCGFKNYQVEFSRLAAENIKPDEVFRISNNIHSVFQQTGENKFQSCFISYSSKDKMFAQKLYDDLWDNNVRCWYADRDILGARKTLNQIKDAISKHERLLIILSENSMQSEWVKTEILIGDQKQTEIGKDVFFPIRLIDFDEIQNWKFFDSDTGKDLAKIVRDYPILNFSKWKEPNAYQNEFNKLLRSLIPIEHE